MGYWRRLFAAEPDRLLRVVATFRHREHVSSGGQGFGSKGWMPTAKAALSAAGLTDYWDDPRKAARENDHSWKARVYREVEAVSDNGRAARMAIMPSVQTYNRLKEWGPNEKAYSFSVGEIGRLGRLVPERYLYDRTYLKGTRLKLLCRLNCLPVMDRVGREAKPKWPKQSRVCFTCGSDTVENVHHFIMDCPRYETKRAGLVTQIRRILARSTGDLTATAFAELGSPAQCEVILGRRIGDPIAEDRIDVAVKSFLTKAWNMRADVTARINAVLGTAYDVQTCALADKLGSA